MTGDDRVAHVLAGIGLTADDLDPDQLATVRKHVGEDPPDVNQMMRDRLAERRRPTPRQGGAQ